jgi:phage tail-like protein
MPVTTRSDPLRAYRFTVEVEGKQVPHVTEVLGLALDIRAHVTADPASPDPKEQAFPQTLLLRRGITKDTMLWDWFFQTLKNPALRRDVRILLLDEKDEASVSWTIHRAYPVRWNGPDLKADQSAVAFESLELAHAGITLG